MKQVKPFLTIDEHINLIYEQYPLVNFKYYGFPDN